MSAVEDVDRLIERFRLSMDGFLKGDSEPTKRVFSHRDDVTLANPYGPPARGMRSPRSPNMPHRRSGMAR